MKVRPTICKCINVKKNEDDFNVVKSFVQLNVSVFTLKLHQGI